MTMFLQVIIFCVVLCAAALSMHLYNTHDGESIEYYDCVMAQSLSYCRRPQVPIDLARDNDIKDCKKNGGMPYLMSQLRSDGINTSVALHQWKSGLEQVERYSRFLSNPLPAFDGYICECTAARSFGKNCEYRLPIGDTIEHVLAWQLEMKHQNPEKVQEYGHIVCYESLKCDSGLLCLDWREICDGIQYCMFGYDEYNCDLLELNRCNDDEYRCMNGMCIPDEYFLDGDFDCLDWSDELPYKKDADCTFEGASTVCDDRICPLHWWSCGDGQCIPDRSGFQKEIVSDECGSRRDQWFICETHQQLRAWTMWNGRCFRGDRYKDLRIKNDTVNEVCHYWLKCSLSNGIETGCICVSGGLGCTIGILNCRLQDVQYPQGSIVGAYGSYKFSLTLAWFNLITNGIRINGTIRCRNFLVSITDTVTDYSSWSARRITEELFCKNITQRGLLENSIGLEECYHANDSTDICNESNTCLSISRIKDGFSNCLNELDELVEQDIDKSCLHVQRHRFRCSVDEPACLIVAALGNEREDCKNKYDEFWMGTDRKLSQMKCNDVNKEECSLLRQYINESWRPTTANVTHNQRHVSFRSYCDTFWDLKSKEDENLTECGQWWICAKDQFECGTKQCISLTWLNDGEWDCADASDESETFKQIIETIEVKNPIANPDNKLEVLFRSCNRTHPFPCLSPHLTQSHTCLSLDRIGNDEIDCAGATDERNKLEHCTRSSSMLGHDYKCLSTNTCIPSLFHCWFDHRCPNRTDDDDWCLPRKPILNCFELKDFICSDGRCVTRGRCNGEIECPFGEDEYMCDYESSSGGKLVPYRERKEYLVRHVKHSFLLPLLPTDANIMVINSDLTSKSTKNISNPSSSHTLAYECNRGIGILAFNGSTVCLCPPQYYGSFCQYQSDRLLVLLHLNISNSIYTTQSARTIVLKLLVLLMFNNQTLMTHEFHVYPAFESTTINKQLIHFLYSRSNFFNNYRLRRYLNRSNIINSHPYSILIELYQTDYEKLQLKFIGLWHYPIFFDHLPVYRFAKTLRLSKLPVENSKNSCSSNPCHGREECHPLINDPSQYLCICPSNFTGDNCSIEDQQCTSGYCSAVALCKPNYRRQLQGNTYPYCVCPFIRYGDRCDISHEPCQSNPCFNNGLCVPSSAPDKVNCVCSNSFFGSLCQWKKTTFHLSLKSDVAYDSAVIQYFDIDSTSFDLILVYQQVHRSVPSFIQYQHDQNRVPAMVIARLYTSYVESSTKVHLLSLHLNVASFNGTTNISQHNQCPRIAQLFKDLPVIRYHHVCSDFPDLLCFQNDFYMCICDANHTRVECFNYNQTLDRCSHCLSGGRCLKGQVNRSDDFLCLCPPCHSGSQCQFNAKLFTFTLDQLFYTDLATNHKHTTVYVIIIISVLIFILGMPSNIFTFITFKRQACHQSGIGYYLLSISMINQINLGLLAARLIHLSITIAFPRSFSTIDNVLCKIFSYTLTSFTRLTYWYASFVSLERALTVIFLNGQWFKQPHVACSLMGLTLIVVFASGAYDLFFVRLLAEIEGGHNAMCIVEFPISRQPVWMIIHQFVSIFHIVLPLLINLCCTIAIIFIVTKTKLNIGMATKYQETITSTQQPTTCSGYRAKSGRTQETLNRLNAFRDVLSEHKEMIARPMITLIPSFFSLFSLPILIISLSLGCQNLERSTSRYFLIATYFISFIPQLSTFFLYISPSTFHSKEWQTTAIARRITTFQQSFSSMSIINLTMRKKMKAKD